ncbi:hypothetical protein ABZS68_18790 [Streptomyces sp. NPDC005571]
MATRTASCPYENTTGRLPPLIKDLTFVTVEAVRLLNSMKG